MRFNHLHELLRLDRYRQLSRDFRNPVTALVASTGLSSKDYVLQTRDGHTMRVNRSDRPVWEAYFQPQQCEVYVEHGLFKIVPQTSDIPAYYISPGNNCVTHHPQRWNPAALKIPLVQQLQAAERSVYSQHGEDGVIEALLQHIPAPHRFLIEFGAHDGINMSNSRHLISNQDWSAFLIEADDRFYDSLARLYGEDKRVNTLKSFVTPENIDDLFEAAGAPHDFEILSIDIDSIDYYVWEGLQRFQPRIVIVEYNSTICPPENYIASREDALHLGGTSRESASLQAFYELGLRKDYQLVYCELSGANAFFIHNSVKHHFDVDWSKMTPELLYQPPQHGALAGGKAINGRGYL